MPYPDVIAPCVFKDADVVQSISGNGKMKPRLATISFIENTIPSKMADQNDDFTVFLLCFLKFQMDDTW